MAFLANSRISILRGTYQDPDGDDADSSRPIAIDVPASLLEQTQTVSSPETGRSVDVKWVAGIVRPRVDVVKGDRILNQNTGDILTVDAVSQSGLFGVADKRLKCRILDA